MNKMLTLYKLGKNTVIFWAQTMFFSKALKEGVHHWSADKVSSCAAVWSVASVHSGLSHNPHPLGVNEEGGRCERTLTKWKTNDKNPVVASPCLKEVCSSAVVFGDVPLACLPSSEWLVGHPHTKFCITAHPFEAQACMHRGLVVGFRLSKSSLTSPVLQPFLLSKNSKYSQMSVCYHLAKTRSSPGICLTTRLCSLFFGLPWRT